MSSRMQTVIVLGVMLMLYTVVASMGRLMLMVPLMFLPLGVFLLARRDILFVAICFLFYSTIRIPMLAGQMELYHAGVALYVVAAFGGYALRRRTVRITPPVLFAIALAIVVAYTMHFRGSGFRLFGSSLWGGVRYVEILLGLSLFIVSDSIHLSLRRWKTALVGMVTVGALPALAELAYVYSKGATSFVYYILQPLGQTGTALERMESGRMVRFSMMLQVSHIYLIPFFLRKVGQRLPIKQLGFILLAIVLGGLSGHRMVLLNVALYLWMYRFLRSKNRLAYSFISAILVSLILLTLGQMAYLLPLNMQRMFSLIPFANISTEANVDAFSTWSWRVELWKDTVKEIPRYLWLGKGFAYSGDLEMALDVRWLSNYGLWWAKVQSAYHQGVLSLLVGLGLPGLLTGTAFLISLCRRHYRFWRQKQLTPDFASLHYAVLVLLMMETSVYFLVYGDVFVSFPKLCLIGAILEGIYRSGRVDNQPVPEHVEPGADDVNL